MRCWRNCAHVNRGPVGEPWVSFRWQRDPPFQRRRTGQANFKDFGNLRATRQDQVTRAAPVQWWPLCAESGDSHFAQALPFSSCVFLARASRWIFIAHGSQMVFSEGLPHTLQMPFEDLGRGACTSGEFTPISFASARGWSRILPPWALSRAIFIISQSDMNIYRKTILMGHRWTAEPLAPASGPARIQASPESPSNYNGGRIVVVSSGCESRSTQRNTNGPAAAGPACNVFKSARNTVAGKPVNWRSEP